jgi:hypothetical protein
MMSVESQQEPRTTDIHLSPAPFFLVGSERSGTTLLRLMLDHHPQLRCGHETDFIVDDLDRYQATPPERLRRVWDSKRAFVSYRRRGLPEPPAVKSYQELVNWLLTALREQCGKDIAGVTVHWGAKRLTTLVPHARYIHLLRDGRAVAQSVVQMGWAGNTYHGALYWRRGVEGVLGLQKCISSDRWLEVRYEDLLTGVEPTLERICGFLGVSYSSSMLEYSKDSSYERVDPANTYRWRTKMKPVDILYAEMAAADLLTQNGYELLFPRFDPGRGEILMLRMHDRYHRWRFNINRFGFYAVMARKLRRALRLAEGPVERRIEAITRAHIR